MSWLPLPVRVAAGLAATAVDEVRKLPSQLPGLPVTVISRALQTSMRIQQQVTELAIRGDEVIALLRPVDDTAPWARFDEDEDEVDTEQRHGERPAGPGGFAPGTTAAGSAAPEGDAPGRVAPTAPTPEPPPFEEGRGGELDEADVARTLSPPHAGPAPPALLPGYEEMTLPQLRGKLRALSLRQLEELLAHEQAHQARPAFVTMLSNRIRTVRSR